MSGALLKSNVSLSGPDVGAFLRGILADDFVQRPVEQMRDGVVPLDGLRGAGGPR